jgi:hypothetical protein
MEKIPKFKKSQNVCVKTFGVMLLMSLLFVGCRRKEVLPAPAQLDNDLQPAIDYDYENGCQHGALSKTVTYFDQFARIYVIEYEGSNAKIIPVYIGNTF